MSICSHVDIKRLGDLEFAGWCSVKCCYVLNEICVDTQREIESCSKDSNSCSSLDSDTKSSFEGCGSRGADDG